MAVPQTTPATSGKDKDRSAMIKIRQDLARFILDDRPDRHLNDHILSILAVHVGSHPVPAILRDESLAVVKIQEGLLAICGLDDHVSSPASVTSIGSTLRDKLLSPEGNTTLSAMASLHLDLDFINKTHG
jgi:hypothetical protein